MKLFKKHLWAVPILVTILLITAGCSNNKSKKVADAQNNDKELTVAVYSGDWAKSIKKAALTAFTKKTGIKVNIVEGADAEWITKLNANKGKTAPYDLLILQPDSIQKAADAQLLEPLKSDCAKNLNDLYPAIQNKLTFNNKLYAAGFSVGQLGLAYRKDLVKNVPEKWSDLWNNEYKGHIAISPLTYSAGLQTFSGIINAQGGKESNSKNVQRAFNSLKTLKSSVTSYPDNPGSIQTLLQRGDTWVVPFWDGRVFALQQSGMKLGFSYPKDGAVAAVASWSIAKDSAHKNNAYKLLNYLSSPTVQKKFSDTSYYGMSNKNVKYSPEVKSKIKTGNKELSTLKWVDYKTADKQLSNWTTQWTNVLGGN
ncbi:ABC transporter substrate-binding protein [Loigolactobacillus binensis]|uniref:PotD/PotF family extracellular solute-binding protein n=1 Tax=Loigolactobacillus binensis TaxID=2559922 RepID=A0ABW3EFL7_9LACO|nr:ABC transporter substrate-binding protein [Loigolactobacillus binensis]